MKPVKRWTTTVAVLAVLMATTWLLPGCSNSPSPMQSEPQVNILQRPVAGKITGDTIIVATVEATTEDGGSIALGDNMIGESSLLIPPSALPDVDATALIQMKLPRFGAVGAVLEPHGIQFRRAVDLTLSYQGADLSNVNEEALKVFYFNEDLGVWEVVPGSQVDTESLVVTAPLMHFSQYAIGSEE